MPTSDQKLLSPIKPRGPMPTVPLNCKAVVVGSEAIVIESI